MFEACCWSSYFALVKHSMSAGRKGSNFCSIFCILRVLSKSHDAWRKPADAFRRFQITPRGRRPNGGGRPRNRARSMRKPSTTTASSLSVAAAGCERAQINSHRPNLVNAQRVHVTRDSDRLCYGAADMCARHLTAVSDVSRSSSCVASYWIASAATSPSRPGADGPESGGKKLRVKLQRRGSALLLRLSCSTNPKQ